MSEYMLNPRRIVRLLKRLTRALEKRRVLRTRREHLLGVIRDASVPAVYLETTSACNLNCVMCPCQRPSIKKIKPDSYMDYDLFCSLVDEISGQTPVPSLKLHKDGEPLLHPRIVEMIDYASSRLPDVMLVTNGTLLDERMASEILETSLQEIRFSIEGSNRETYAKVRRQSPDNPHRMAASVEYESVVENIVRFCRMRKALGKDTPRVGVRMTEFEPTREETDAAVAFWKEHVDYVRVVPLLSWSGAVTVRKDMPSARYPCMHLWKSQVISADGTMVPCCIYVDKTGKKAGRLTELTGTSMQQAFVSARANELRRAHIAGELDGFEFCVGCMDWDFGKDAERLWSDRFKKKMLREIGRAEVALRR